MIGGGSCVTDSKMCCSRSSPAKYEIVTFRTSPVFKQVKITFHICNFSNDPLCFTELYQMKLPLSKHFRMWSKMRCLNHKEQVFSTEVAVLSLRSRLGWAGKARSCALVSTSLFTKETSSLPHFTQDLGGHFAKHCTLPQKMHDTANMPPL